jgi:NAD(P)-dependent dehydrogenase (short-subunit alcohol dehydrogenase family)
MVVETAVGIGTPVILDITAPEAGERLARAALDAYGRIDILVNNAGIGGSKALEESDDALLVRFIDTNLTSVLRVTRGVLPHLAQPGGAIVNVSSIFGLVGYPGSTAYAAAKGGVAQVTRQLAGDLGPKGIRVNAVAPGVVLTPMTQNHFRDPYYTRMLVDSSPLGRYAEPRNSRRRSPSWPRRRLLRDRRRPARRRRFSWPRGGAGTMPEEHSWTMWDMSVRWPNGARCAVMLTFDFDAETLWTSRDPANANRQGVLSQGRYGAKVGVPKILDLLAEEEVTSTVLHPRLDGREPPGPGRDGAESGARDRASQLLAPLARGRPGGRAGGDGEGAACPQIAARRGP